VAFKVGDIVRCISPTKFATGLIDGKLYEITDIDSYIYDEHDIEGQDILKVDNGSTWWLSERFELATKQGEMKS